METEDNFELTRIIGDCGIFQVLLTLTTNSATMVCAWTFMFMTFGAYNPGWTCLDETNLTYLNLQAKLQQNNSSACISSSLGSISNDTQWSHDCSVRRGCHCLVYSPEASTIVTEFDLSCESSFLPSIIISIEMVGAFLGCIAGGQMGDRLGRKTSMYSHLLLQTICHLGAAFSVSWQMYAFLSFFLGFGAAGISSNSYPYPLEFANGWWRGVIVSIPDWSISFLIFTVVVYFVRNWMYMHIIAASISACVLLTVFWIPESIRWLAVSGKVNKAKRVVSKIARMNRRTCPDTQAIDNLAEHEKAQMRGHKYTYLDLFKMRELRGISIKLGLIWIIMSFFFYGISFGLKSIAGNVYINLMLSAVLEIPAFIFVAPLVNNIGRRMSALICIAFATLCCIVVIVLSFVTSGNIMDTSILVMALLSKMTITGLWGIFNVFSVELYPTVLRTIAYGYLNCMSRIPTIVAPYLFPNNRSLLHVPFIALGILGVLAFAFTWSLSETSGKQLKDILKIADNPKLKVKNNTVAEA